MPHPLTVYSIDQAENAIRIKQQGKHCGKIVLSFSEDDKVKAPVLCKTKDSLKLDPNATFLLISGLDGLGRSLAREFVASGARHIAFISRSGDSKPEAKATADGLAALGAQDKVLRGDVADQASFLCHETVLIAARPSKESSRWLWYFATYWSRTCHMRSGRCP